MQRQRTSLLLPVALLAGCGSATDPGPGPLERANVLLVVVDTLGASHLGSYRSSASSSPRLDQLAEQSVRFERAYSSAPWTQPSVASLFTALMPSRHGVRNVLDRLPAETSTLAETLSEAGYSTHAVISHFLIGKEFGYDQGFVDTFDASAVAGHDGITSEKVTDRAIRVLEQKDERPFFLFVHYFDPHFLYQHHPEFDRTADYGGNLSPATPLWQLRDVRDQLGTGDIRYLVNLYHEEIAFTDAQIGRLLDRLQSLGHAEDTLVLFTADHGEEFMEHDWIGHTRNLFDTLVRVPLLLRYPGAIAPRVVATPVSTLDVTPTLLDLVLGQPPGAHMEGVSLAETLLNGSAPADRELFLEVSFEPVSDEEKRNQEKRAFKTALIHGQHKLIHDLTTDTLELYELDRDAGEQRNIFGRDLKLSERLEARLRAWEQTHTETAGEKGSSASEEDLERLRALGYVR